MSKERERLSEPGPWRRWGPYLSERQWATVREDRSRDGNAWESFSHDEARSRAYRWGEDGLAGLCDDRQLLCFALALWNERDPILKERAFGLTNGHGNHGEDVKEYYFFLDSTPTHSWMRWLYKYPQAPYPYTDLVEENGRRGPQDFEYELVDTGVFAEDRYFDVVVEYAKASPDDVLIRIAVTNNGPEAAPLHLLPALWFRNTWTAHDEEERPRLSRASGIERAIRADHPSLGVRYLHIDADCPFLFTENETNAERFGEAANPTPYVKDAFHEVLVGGRLDAANSAAVGTKAAAHLHTIVGAGETWSVRLRLTSEAAADPFAAFDEIRAARSSEAAPRFPATGSATRRGTTWRTRTSSRCRTRGSTPGTPHGISPSIAPRSPSSIRSSRRASSS